MRNGKRFGFGLVAIGLAALSLSACSSVLPGSSRFGDNQLSVADLPAVNDTTEAGALQNARAHFRNNDFGYSAAYYKKAVELSPNDAEAYAGLGASYDRLGRFELSDRVYATLYSVGGATVQYYNNLGYSYLLRGNLALALSNFRKARALAPNNPVIANNLQMLQSARA